MTGKGRRTLRKIAYYPSPAEISKQLEASKGWPYRTEDPELLDYYHKRDKALLCLLYLLAVRVSEALRLTTDQFHLGVAKTTVYSILLSKSVRKDKLRNYQYRQEAWLPRTGPRGKLTKIVEEYLALVPEKERLFQFGTVRAWQIITALLDLPPHWFRAFGEDYLYRQWDHDLMAVANYIKVDARTLQQYITSGYDKYKAV